MQYDGKGIRVAKTRKIGTSVTTNSTYIYDNGGKLRTEIEGSTTRNYIYGADGIVGYEENGEHFMYRKNFFGDIVAIYKGATKIAEYSYDAWGNCTIVSDYNGYGARNPFRYRGYYFDTDLNMYYLTTRYYDPQTGRFINTDTIKYLKPDTINGLNLYAYCLNNPIINEDPFGNEPIILSAFATFMMDLALTVVALVLVVGLVAYIKHVVDSKKETSSPKEEPPITDEELIMVNQALMDLAFNMFGGTGAGNIAARMFDTEDWLDLDWQ